MFPEVAYDAGWRGDWRDVFEEWLHHAVEPPLWADAKPASPPGGVSRRRR